VIGNLRDKTLGEQVMAFTLTAPTLLNWLVLAGARYWGTVEFTLIWRACVNDPDIAVTVHIHAMRPCDHPRAKTLNDIPLRIHFDDWVDV